MKEPLKGINALSLLVAIASQLDLHPDLADQALGETSPLPSWSYLRDFEGAVRCIDRASYGWLFQCIAFEENTSRAPTADLWSLVREALDAFYKSMSTCGIPGWPRPYDCKAKSHHLSRTRGTLPSLRGYQAFREASNKKAEQDFRNGTSYQSLAIQQIQRLPGFLGDKDPMVVIGFAPLLSFHELSLLDNTDLNIVSLITDYRQYLDTRGYLLKVEEYFMGLTDTSYCALEKDVTSYQVVLDSWPPPAQGL